MSLRKPLLGFILLLGFALFLLGNSAKCEESLTLTTTTSPQDSGLLEALIPPFETANKVKVKVIAVGTGQALEIARRGDADVVMVHALEMEKAFVKEGYGLARQPFMYDDFVIAGPANDPAKIRGEHSAVEAFRRIAQTQSPFMSRGDNSGTQVKELEIWHQAGIKPGGSWYGEAGSGMAATLRVASEKQAYTLTDRPTLVVWQDKLALSLLAEGDPLLRNIYSVIVVNPQKHPGVKVALAKHFAAYLLSPSTGKIIADFGKAKYHQPLYYSLVPPKPAAKPKAR
jgi:tungstate transport system substrate-binding protein